LGSSEKKLSLSESENIKIVRKSIVASQDIENGELLTEKNVTVKRPGNGINPMMWDNIIGTVATKDYKIDSLI